MLKSPGDLGLFKFKILNNTKASRIISKSRAKSTNMGGLPQPMVVNEYLKSKILNHHFGQLRIG